jgi:hypothetical protein
LVRPLTARIIHPAVSFQRAVVELLYSFSEK